MELRSGVVDKLRMRQQRLLAAFDAAMARLGSYPIVTPQHSPTTLYQGSYRVQSLFF
jgi:hypothetical protein